MRRNDCRPVEESTPTTSNGRPSAATGIKTRPCPSARYSDDAYNDGIELQNRSTPAARPSKSDHEVEEFSETGLYVPPAMTPRSAALTSDGLVRTLDGRIADVAAGLNDAELTSDGIRVVKWPLSECSVSTIITRGPRIDWPRYPR